MSNKSAQSAHGLVVHRLGGMGLLSHHLTDDMAKKAQARRIEVSPLQVMPINVVLSDSGNVRLWTAA